MDTLTLEEEQEREVKRSDDESKIKWGTVLSTDTLRQVNGRSRRHDKDEREVNQSKREAMLISDGNDVIGVKMRAVARFPLHR